MEVLGSTNSFEGCLDFFFCCYNKMPRQRQCGQGRVILTHSFRLWSIMGKSQQQELKASQPQSGNRKQQMLVLRPFFAFYIV